MGIRSLSATLDNTAPHVTSINATDATKVAAWDCSVELFSTASAQVDAVAVCLAVP